MFFGLVFGVLRVKVAPSGCPVVVDCFGWAECADVWYVVEGIGEFWVVPHGSGGEGAVGEGNGFYSGEIEGVSGEFEFGDGEGMVVSVGPVEVGFGECAWVVGVEYGVVAPCLCVLGVFLCAGEVAVGDV